MLKAAKEHQLIIDSSDAPLSEQLKLLISSGVLAIMVPDFTALLDDALRESDITVIFTPSEELPSGRGWFMRDTNRAVICRKIFIPNELNLKEALSALLHELCNAALPTELLDTVEPKQHADRDAYALAMARMEYQSYKRHAQIYHNYQTNIEGFKTTYRRVINAIATLINSSSPYPTTAEPEKKPSEILSFEEIWERDNIATSGQMFSHAESFRLQFDKYSIARSFDAHPEFAQFCKGFASFLRTVAKQKENSESFNSKQNGI